MRFIHIWIFLLIIYKENVFVLYQSLLMYTNFYIIQNICETLFFLGNHEALHKSPKILSV